jgi:multimeric flavodoxin WrbA
MKVMTILGSPRKKGNTAKVLGWMEDELRAAGSEVERVVLVEHEIKGCLGCYACKRNDKSPGCVQKDDAVAIFTRMMEADAIVYASPLYCWDFTAQMKSFIDRHICLVKEFGTPDHKSALRGKRTALLVTCEDAIENNADVIQIVFDRCNEFLETTVAGKSIIPFCTTPDALSDEARQTAKKLADAVIS